MQDDQANELTAYLNDESVGTPSTQAKLIKMVYSDLKHIAINRLATESPNSTLTVTSLVHEAFLKLNNVHSMTWSSRRHYFGAAAEAMRRILIDRARYHLRNRREGAKASIPLEEGIHVEGVKPDELIALSDALTDLESFDEELAELVKLKFFAGLSAEEIAEIHETSPRTILRKIQSARAWLLVQVSQEQA